MYRYLSLLDKISAFFFLKVEPRGSDWLKEGEGKFLVVSMRREGGVIMGMGVRF